MEDFEDPLTSYGIEDPVTSYGIAKPGEKIR